MRLFTLLKDICNRLKYVDFSDQCAINTAQCTAVTAYVSCGTVYIMWTVKAGVGGTGGQITLGSVPAEYAPALGARGFLDSLASTSDIGKLAASWMRNNGTTLASFASELNYSELIVFCYPYCPDK